LAVIAPLFGAKDPENVSLPMPLIRLSLEVLLGSPLLPRKISDFAFSFWTFHWQLATGRWQLLLNCLSLDTTLVEFAADGRGLARILETDLCFQSQNLIHHAFGTDSDQAPEGAA